MWIERLFSSSNTLDTLPDWLRRSPKLWQINFQSKLDMEEETSSLFQLSSILQLTRVTE